MATTTCSKCQTAVPSHNFELHELRCPGPSATGRPAAAPNYASAAASVEASRPTPDQIAQALTWARTNPQEVVDAMQERLLQYKGLEYYPPERKGRCVVTKEGTKVVEEAIEFVRRLEPMGGVGSSSETGLALAGEDHIADVGQTGTASHSSSDGTTSSERVTRYGSFSMFGECLWYGSESADARTMVLDLIVDDGVPSRGHRKGVLNPDYQVVGTACGPHVTFGAMSAMEFARGWDPNDMFIRSRKQTGPVKIAEQVTAKAKAKADTQWALGACPLCKEAIKGGRVVEIPQLGGKLHADCFKCGGCSTQLTGVAYKVQAKAPYCNPCFFERFGDKCVACNEVMTAGSMKCALGSFHIECVICATCKQVIGKALFSTANGVFACQDCAGPGASSKAGGKASQAPGSGRAASPARGSGRASPAKASALSSAGNAILGKASPVPKAVAKSKSGVSPAAPKAKAKPKAVSMMAAKNTLVGVGMSYADF